MIYTYVHCVKYHKNLWYLRHIKASHYYSRPVTYKMHMLLNVKCCTGGFYYLTQPYSTSPKYGHGSCFAVPCFGLVLVPHRNSSLTQWQSYIYPCAIEATTKNIIPVLAQQPFPDSKVHGPTLGPHGANRTQMGPMLAPWTLLSEFTILSHC